MLGVCLAIPNTSLRGEGSILGSLLFRRHFADAKKVRELSAANAEHLQRFSNGKVMVVDAGKCGHFRRIADALKACPLPAFPLGY